MYVRTVKLSDLNTCIINGKDYGATNVGMTCASRAVRTAKRIGGIPVEYWVSDDISFYAVVMPC